MGKAILAEKVRQQKEELAIREEARRSADRMARKECVNAIVQLCTEIMDCAVKRSKNSSVVCFERGSTSAAMKFRAWKRVLSKLAAVGYTAELVDTVPDVMAKPSAGTFKSYERDYVVNTTEYIQAGILVRNEGYHVIRKFASLDGKMVAIRISLV